MEISQGQFCFYNFKISFRVTYTLFNNIGVGKSTDHMANGRSFADMRKKLIAETFSLGGASKWTSMMWLEYMFDRIGGPDVFNNIYAGKKDSWGDPSALKAYTMIQELIDANGFIKGFMSVTADSNADLALLYTGKAAMMLHGGWAYSGIKSAQAAFVKSDLAYGTFPSRTSSATRPTTGTSRPRRLRPSSWRRRTGWSKVSSPTA